jgi:hypothetical protein
LKPLSSALLSASVLVVCLCPYVAMASKAHFHYVAPPIRVHAVVASAIPEARWAVGDRLTLKCEVWADAAIENCGVTLGLPSRLIDPKLDASAEGRGSFLATRDGLFWQGRLNSGDPVRFTVSVRAAECGAFTLRLAYNYRLGTGESAVGSETVFSRCVHLAAVRTPALRVPIEPNAERSPEVEKSRGSYPMPVPAPTRPKTVVSLGPVSNSTPVDSCGCLHMSREPLE